MWVRSGHRGTGIALGLVEHVVASTAGDALVLHVLPDNARAQALYRRAGSCPTGPTPTGRRASPSSACGTTPTAGRLGA